VFAAQYIQIHSAADCCRSNGAKIDHSGNGFAATPGGCEELCDSTFGCLYFSHSTKWDNCQLCSECDLITSGNAKYYTSWERVKEECTQDTQCGDGQLCIGGFCYRHNCVNTLDDTLCKIKADNGNCYTNARIPGSSITYRTYMEERCNQACGYCIAGIKKPSTTCFGESYVADEMLTASMAHEQCKQDPNCAAVVDLKCNNQVARFCPIGYTEKTDSSSCTYPKIECSTNTDCPANRPVCTDGVCYATCNSDADCRSVLSWQQSPYCHGGICLAN